MRMPLLIVALLSPWFAGQTQPPGTPSGQESPTTRPPEDFWLASGPEIVVVAGDSHAQRGRAEVGVNANLLVPSKSRRFVAVTSIGAIKKKGLFGGLEDWPEPGAKSLVTVFRNDTLEPVARIEVAFRPGFLGFADDDRTLVVASFGQVHKDPKKHIAPRVYAVDVATGKVRHEAPLASEPRALWLMEDAGRLIAALAGHKDRPDAPPELIVFDGNSGAVERARLPSTPIAFRRTGAESTRYLELEKAVLVVDASGRPIGEPIRAGDEHLFLLEAPGGGRSFLAGRTKKAGKVLVLESGAVSRALDTPPLIDVVFDSKGGRLLLCGGKQGLVLDAADLSQKATLALPDDFRDVHLHPSGERLYVNETDDNVSVIDVGAGRQVARFSSGRGGKKFLLAALAGVASALSPYRYGPTIRMPVENYNVPAALQAIAFAPNGRHVFVYNSVTADVTVVETERHTSPLKVGTGAASMWSAAGGSKILAVGWNKIVAFDAETGKVAYEREFPKSTIRYLGRFELALVRTKTHLEVWRAQPLEKAASLPSPDADVVALDEERILFVSDGTRTTIYDDSLRSLGEVATKGDNLRVWKVERATVGN